MQKHPDRDSAEGRKKYVPALVSAGIVLFTFLLLRKVCLNGLLRWDDSDYIALNPDITSFSISKAGQFFTSFHMGNYHPLTMLSFALNYAIWKLDPSGYHAVNLFLHLVNTLLVFLFIYRLTGGKLIITAFVSLIFGIHPMHVESVAWVSARKDLLYTLFYLSALVIYLRYLREGRIILLLTCLGFFLFSLFSKGQAITLPFILLVIDYYLRERFTRRRWLEKIPFFLLSILFGIIAVYAQRSQHALAEIEIPYLHRILFASYGLMVYTVKSILPLNLCGFYQYLFTESGRLPLVVIASPAIHLSGAFVIIRYLRNNRHFIAGVLFYLFTIVMVLQLVPIGKAVIAERYTYIPYIGLFFAYSEIFNRKWMSGRRKYLAYIPLTGLLLFFTVKSHGRVQVWKDDITFWTDVVKRDPMLCMAYLNRAMSYFFDEQKFDDAIADCRKVADIDRNNKESFRHAGFFSYMSNQPEMAVHYLNKGLEIDPLDEEMLLFRANAYRNLKKYPDALKDYDAVIRRFGSTCADDRLYSKRRRLCLDAWFHRGIMYCDHMGEPAKGIEDFNRLVAMDPDYKHANFNLCAALYNTGNWEKAACYATRVIRGNETENLPAAYYIRGMCYQRTREFEKSASDLRAARQLGYGPSADK